MKTKIAFLRAINLGKINKIKMQKLINIFEEVGCADIRTYIQTGNVIFRYEDSVKITEILIEEKIYEVLELKISVILRSLNDLYSIVNTIQFYKEEDALKLTNIAFIKNELHQYQIDKLNSMDFAPDKFYTLNREVIFYCNSSYAESKINNSIIEKKMKVISTCRRLNVLKNILKMAEKYIN